MNLWRSLGGIVEVRLVTADLPGILEDLRSREVAVYRMKYEDELTAVLTLPRNGLAALSIIAEKRGETVSIVRKAGLYWTAAAVLNRPVLLAGLLVLFLLSLYLPTRVLFVRVEGNTYVPSRQILESAEESGIRFGASRREVRSEKVKNALLGKLPDLQWAGVNTAGCVATVSVRERSDTDISESGREVSSLVASRDGIVLSCTVTEGSAVCTVGQAVKEGQILISGYTDCGLLIQATRAEGEIMAQTRHQIYAVTPSDAVLRGGIRETGKSYSLIIGKKRINLWNSSGICDGACGRMYEEYYINLPGGFVLPAALAVDTHICYASEVIERSEEECLSALASFCERYVLSRMVSGSLLDRDTDGAFGKGVFQLDAEYLCVEMIGRRRQEKQE